MDTPSTAATGPKRFEMFRNEIRVGP